MITVFVRLRVDNWDRFRDVHDGEGHLRLRQERGNLTHHALTQLDDSTDVVFLDTWNMPQDSDSYYHSDDFQRHLDEMGATVVEIIKLEHARLVDIGEEPAIDEVGSS
jgi:quinol monooxygenase YgiN